MSLDPSIASRLKRDANGLFAAVAQERGTGQVLMVAWMDDDALAAFVREMQHRTVMVRLRPHMGATRFVTWRTPGSELPPPWDDAVARLLGPAASAPRRL